MNNLPAKFGVAVWMAIMLVGFCQAQSPKTDVYFAKQLWDGRGEPIEDAALLVQDGKILAVGPRLEVEVPATANRHELGDQTIIPGLIATGTSLAGNQAEERTVTPQLLALDGFDFFDDRIDLLRAGITTAHVSPTDARLMPGVSGVVRLAGTGIGDRILQEQESLRIVLAASARTPPRIYEPPVGPVSEERPLDTTRPQFSTLSSSLAGLRQIFKRVQDDQSRVSTDGQTDEIVATIKQLRQQKLPIHITAVTAPEIRGAVQLAKEFELPIVLVDCSGLEPFQDVFADWQGVVQGVVLRGNAPGGISNPSVEEIKNASQPWRFAKALLDAGIPVVIRPPSDGNLPQLMFVAGQFMQGGLDKSEVLAALTSHPATLLRVADRVGSLAKGKSADFVVLDAEPFQLRTRVMATYAAGVPVYERKREVQTTVVAADKIYLGDGHFLDHASVVVKGQTVRGVGPSVSAPLDADVKRFPGGVIVPGFVDMGAGLGIGGPLRGRLALQTKLGEQLFADDPAIAYARQQGITTALLTSGDASGAAPIVAFKLGPDARVISDPVAIRFGMSKDTATAIAANEKLLQAGKAYADSWNDYEKALAEYEVKVQAAEKAKSEKPESGDAEKKTEGSAKTKPDDKGESKDSKEKEAEDKDEAQDKPAPEKKPGEEKGKEKPEKKPAPLPDPITGTWEGELQSERLPPQIRTLTFELELQDKQVTGSVSMMRNTTDISAGSFDRDTRELSLTISRRGAEVTITGTLDESGAFSGTIDLGRMGTVELTATRTVDKSKKPEPDPEEKKEGKPDKPVKDKEQPEKDQPEKDQPDKDKEDKPGDPKKETKDDTDQPTDKPNADKESPDAKQDAADKTASAEELNPPKKPKESADLEPYRALFAGKIPAFVEARDLNAMRAAAELFAKKYQLRTVILGADDLARQPDLLNGYDVSVCTGPSFSVKIDKQPATILPQLFANERLAFGFQSNGTTGSGQLPAAIQYLVSQGLSTNDALQGLTSHPAKMLSDEMNFGRIEAGKDADLVVLSGPPFEFSTTVLAVMIDGTWVYEREEDK